MVPDSSILQLPTGAFECVEIHSQGFNDERLIPTGVDTQSTSPSIRWASEFRHRNVARPIHH
jgi:hypothetical protein